MSILCVGSVALDSVETPFGKADRVLGGSAVYFSAAATVFNPVQLVGVVGDDYPIDDLGFLAERGADLSGIEKATGKSFFWAGRYHYDLNTRDTLDTQLGVTGPAGDIVFMLLGAILGHVFVPIGHHRPPPEVALDQDVLAPCANIAALQ